MGESKVGVRTIWTAWNDDLFDAGGFGEIVFDTYMIDLEVFKRLSLGERTILPADLSAAGHPPDSLRIAL